MKKRKKVMLEQFRGSKPVWIQKRPEAGQKTALGLCLGASTLSIAMVEEPDGKTPKIIGYALYPHEGNPKKTLYSALNKIDPDAFDTIALTGRKFRKIINLSSISESEAVELAYQFIRPAELFCPAVVSAGGETFMVYALNRLGQISNVITGNKCASGTGEFFMQQLRRMNVTITEAAQWSTDETPHQVSGRCSVFCKSDCTHATNAGIPKPKVVAGLCKMMANKVLELLKKVEKNNIMIVGGTAQNKMMVKYLDDEIPGLIVPREAPYFEALGAALWALENETLAFPGFSELIKNEVASFDTLPLLENQKARVHFKHTNMGVIEKGDECILGLDVGSTTTKAVLIRKADDAMVASIYLRTNGDPVSASRQCYRAILSQVKAYVDPGHITVSGLGVTGSGRQIAGLHALTDNIINEIIAHATAAIYFDPAVDTIFEIGGQDAKYTYITNAVPSDYAMNEACSAGTGSFLEESAYETMGVKMEDIAEIALKGTRAPNFNDQCAAFIASDIKNAIHEGIEKEDIMAGLVYSICMNYANRVKGNRPVGEKVFMQGGVCYNRAVPLAMAALVGKPIIVPPEPGLMGAFGVALEVKKRMDCGLSEKSAFDLTALANRQVKYGKTFFCNGGKEKCDRHCEIAMISLDGKRYSFGGACNRYYNLRKKIKTDVGNLDLVQVRQHLVFKKYGARISADRKADMKGTVGFNRSFLINTYYPLYSTFFTEIGFEPVMPESVSQEGIDRRDAAFCYPAELAHGFYYTLLTQNNPPDYIFTPHIKAIPASTGHTNAPLCPFVQSEPYYLQTTFSKEIKINKKKGTQLLTPLIDLTLGLEDARKPLIKIGLQMGASYDEAQRAYEKAMTQQLACEAEMKAIGRQTLQTLAADPARIAVVLIARAYNGFAKEANKGIPRKITSRGIMIIPFDFLPADREETKTGMYWGMGQRMLQAGRLIQKHPQLFGMYITNFSCGPDSFLVGYFRTIQEQKPSLTLELDSHTADAGLETRIEAFLDIVAAYQHLTARKMLIPKQKTFVPARTSLNNGRPEVILADGTQMPFTDDRVTFLIPSMGEIATAGLAAAFRSEGLKALPHPPPDEGILKLGRANTSCKECLPLILTTGTLLNYIQTQMKADEVLVYFMPSASGPCRFGQYNIFMKELIKKHEIDNVAIFSLSSENAYAGLGNHFHRKAWWAILVSDVMEDIRSMLLTNAVNPEGAIDVFKQEWERLVTALEKGNFSFLEDQLNQSADVLSKIATKKALKEVPVITLAGEIFVRRESLSRQYLTEQLAKRGFATVCAPIAEWLLYSDYLVDKGLTNYSMSKIEKMEFLLKKKFMRGYEKRIKTILTKTGLVHMELLDIDTIINNATPYVSNQFVSECILTVGSILTDVASHTCGAIAIGPFGCMPNRISEAILNETMSRKGKLATANRKQELKIVLRNIEDLPFLAIESDGSPFPQIINAKLDAFCLRAKRLHDAMLNSRRKGKRKMKPRFYLPRLFGGL
jgi:predicted CoA-substrate-specific enzyme activase